MMSGDKKLIYFLVALIILFSIILLIKIKTTLKYNPIVYNEIYDEYEKIFGKENSIQENNLNNTQNIQDIDPITEETNVQITNIKTRTPSNTEQGNVIGKIIIPKIDINYPIIKETTTEYLKIAPTKYCGPEVNEIRKFSYSRA